MFGYEKNEMIGKHVSIVNSTTDKSAEDIAKEIMEYTKRHRKWEGEIENIRKISFFICLKISRKGAKT